MWSKELNVYENSRFGSPRSAGDAELAGQRYENMTLQSAALLMVILPN